MVPPVPEVEREGFEIDREGHGAQAHEWLVGVVGPAIEAAFEVDGFIEGGGKAE